eukprot:IDg5588t1
MAQGQKGPTRPRRGISGVANASNQAEQRLAPAPSHGRPETRDDAADSDERSEELSVAKKRKEAPMHAENSADSYDEETVRVLIDCLKECGYGNKTKQKKSLNDVFKASVDLASSKHGVARTAAGWKKKFYRIRKDYDEYITAISQSGRDGDDENLFNKPNYYELVHELLRHKARHDPPAMLSTATFGERGEDGSTITSTKKRIKREQSMTLEEADKRNSERHNELLAEIRKGNEHRANFNSMFDRLLDKF